MNQIQLSFNLTGRCNLACAYCAVYRGELKTPDMKPEIIEGGYNKIRGMHPNSLLDLNCMGFGEPLINWEAIEKVDNIKNLDDKVRCFVTSNGTFQERVLDLAKRDWIITISYDGIHNEDLRGKSYLVEDTINKLGKVNNAKFLIRMTVTPEDLDHLNDSLNYVKDLGAEYIVLGPVFPFGRYKDQKLDSSFDMEKIYHSVRHANEIGLKPILSIEEACTLATKGYYIMPNGKLSICYIENIHPTEENRKKASEQGCLLKPYKELLSKK